MSVDRSLCDVVTTTEEQAGGEYDLDVNEH
jgi:hypothetical protein